MHVENEDRSTTPLRETPPAASGCAVIVVEERAGAVIPAAAVPAVRGAAAIYTDPGLSQRHANGVDGRPVLDVGPLLAEAGRHPVVLVTPDVASPHAAALRGAGASVLEEPAPAGAELLEAVRVMDRLRSPGGCPWDAEQDHDSLRKYLVEETYELLEALEERDRAAVREELGDVLLQVLFHARVAAEDSADPFDVDEVASELVAKLVSRHPHVFESDVGTPLDPQAQHQRWEELKQAEKQRESILDGVPTGQPALALVAKIAQRTARAGVPADLLPDGESMGERLFARAAQGHRAGQDPEDELRDVALHFAGRVRWAERRAKLAGYDPSRLTAQRWRRYWPDGPVESEVPGESDARED